MQKMVSTLFLLPLFLCISCEEVVDVETPTDDPRLVVEALIRVDDTESFLPVQVKVSLTNNFFEEIPVTDLESIVIFYEEFEDGISAFTGSSTLAEIAPGTGIYEPDPNFMDDQRIPTIVIFAEKVVFNMIIRHQGRTYFSETEYVPAVPILSIQQGNRKFFGEDDTELIVLFADDASRNNNYVFDFDFNEYLVTDDQFYQGQLFQFSYFYDRRFEPGTEIDISILGADTRFYNYMDLLIEQSAESTGVFQTPVATVRGNVFDITDLDNNQVVDNVARPDEFPLGYFAVVQEYKQTITIQ